MPRINMTSSSAVNFSTFDHPYHTYSEEPTPVEQSYLPLVPNHHPGSTCPLQDSSHHSPTDPIPSILLAEPGFRSLHNSLEMSVPPLPNYPILPLVVSTEHHTIPMLSFADGEHPYTIPHADQPRLHHINEATSEVVLASNSPELSYSTPMILRAHGLPGPTDVTLSSVGAFDQTQVQAVVHLPMSMAVHGFEENNALHAAPHAPPPVATASYHTNHLNIVHTCQYVTGGSLCDAEVGGTVASVRDHLKRVHSFRSAGKDTTRCLWVGCDDTLQRESIPRHIVSRHLRVKVRCVECGLPLSRRDVQYSHARACRARRQPASGVDSDVSSTSRG